MTEETAPLPYKERMTDARTRLEEIEKRKNSHSERIAELRRDYLEGGVVHELLDEIQRLQKEIDGDFMHHATIVSLLEERDSLRALLEEAIPTMTIVHEDDWLSRVKEALK